jgi:hypothetical protein
MVACVALASLAALAADELVNRAARASLVAAARGLTDVTPDDYVLHRVEGNPTTIDATVDAVFGDGFAMRCTVSDSVLTDCVSVSPQYEGWMRRMIDSAMAGSGGGQAGSGFDDLWVADGLVDSLANELGTLGGDYTISRDAQYADWVVMSARSNASAAVTCYFHGQSPVVANHCSGS